MTARYIQVERRPFRHDRNKPQPRGVHVVARILHHQLKRRFSYALLTGDLALYRNQIAVPILIINDGLAGILAF